MKNCLMLILSFFAIFSFNNLYAGQAKLTLVETVTSGEINEGENAPKTKIHLHSFKAFSRDDCEKAMTLKGTIEIIDILEPWQKNSAKPSRVRGFKSKTSRASGRSKGMTSFKVKTPSERPYRKYKIEPTVGNSTTFDSTFEDARMWEFHNQFYIVFKLQDVDRCRRGSSDIIDINPQKGMYESLKLHVDIAKKEIRLVKSDGSLGAVVSATNNYFVVQGKDALPNVELGGLRLKVSRTAPMIGGGNTLQNNGG